LSTLKVVRILQFWVIVGQFQSRNPAPNAFDMPRTDIAYILFGVLDNVLLGHGLHPVTALPKCRDPISSFFILLIDRVGNADACHVATKQDSESKPACVMGGNQ